MTTPRRYQPPYTLTPAVLNLATEVSELVGQYAILSDRSLTPRLRRENRIRTIQASLAIEQNTLSVEQVTAVIAGKRVLGHPREIQEVRNAFASYEAMDGWDACSEKDMLAAHGILMALLVDEPGVYRSGGVGIFRGKELVHMAPPAKRVGALMGDLFAWLKATKDHPLVVSSVFHYEFEFIHPFADGNGRMGRLWQTFILRRWKPLFAWLPVETIIHERQDEYYAVLARSDENSDATHFVEFMLAALLDAVKVAITTDQASDQVTDQVAKLVKVLARRELGGKELREALGLSHPPTFRQNYLTPAIEAGFIERTQPDSPRSPTQRYRLTARGGRILEESKM
ncbi:MAG: Fic family protein [Planctomycetes bacterium]|nr:Fic family protein [Planctomycetota bacterium]